jgi:hypothetical protein
MMNYLLGALGIGYYTNRPLSTLSKKELKRVIFLTTWYCRYELGTNFRRPVPKVVVMNNPYDEGYYGEYDPETNEIHVYGDVCKNLGRLTSTIIHEYTHYLQPIASKYYKLLKEHGYDNHPHEVEARNNEYVHNRRALIYLRQNMES